MRRAALFTVSLLTLFLSACGGGGGSAPATIPAPTGGGTVMPTPSVSQTKLDDKDAAMNFLARATWGGSPSQVDALTGGDAANWLQGQFNKPFRPMTPLMKLDSQGRNIGNQADRKIWWDMALMGDDPLRYRMAFALSQIVVASNVSQQDARSTQRMADYKDILGRNAFGNYRDILLEVTYNPQMAEFLTFRSNRPANADGTRQPDENYAREIMQLFSIGLNQLNMDGTVKRSADGQPLETYTNEDVVGLSRVFTGIAYPPETVNNFWGRPNPDDTDGNYGPLVIWPDYHSAREKVFLGTTIPAGTSGEESVRIAIDTIFDHPNVAPFVSRQLIQRFTASNPSPSYIERVANAFDAGVYRTADGKSFGTSQRGDLQATLAAILLDSQFFDDTPPTERDGKLREPVLKFAHWAKAGEVENLRGSNEWDVFNGMHNGNQLSQAPFMSPSVFNFYRPGFSSPGSQTAAAGLSAPELQLINEGSHRSYLDYMFGFVVDSTTRLDAEIDSFQATYPSLTALSDDPAAMVDWLDSYMISGTFEPQTRQRIIDLITSVELSGDDIPRRQYERAKMGVYLTVTSAEYGVQF